MKGNHEVQSSNTGTVVESQKTLSLSSTDEYI